MSFLERADDSISEVERAVSLHSKKSKRKNRSEVPKVIEEQVE